MNFEDGYTHIHILHKTNTKNYNQLEGLHLSYSFKAKALTSGENGKSIKIFKKKYRKTFPENNPSLRIEYDLVTN